MARVCSWTPGCFSFIENALTDRSYFSFPGSCFTEPIFVLGSRQAESRFQVWWKFVSKQLASLYRFSSLHEEKLSIFFSTETDFDWQWNRWFKSWMHVFKSVFNTQYILRRRREGRRFALSLLEWIAIHQKMGERKGSFLDARIISCLNLVFSLWLQEREREKKREKEWERERVTWYLNDRSKWRMGYLSWVVAKWMTGLAVALILPPATGLWDAFCEMFCWNTLATCCIFGHRGTCLCVSLTCVSLLLLLPLTHLFVSQGVLCVQAKTRTLC